MHRLVVASIAALASAIGIASAHAAPQITSVTPSSGPTTGGAVLTISGTGFSAAGNFVAVGSAACPVSAETPDEIRCTLPPGTGASRSIRVIGGGEGSPPFPFAYGPPLITSVTAASFPTAGGVALTITGENFGPAGAPQLAALRSSVFRECSGLTMETEHVKLTCTLPPGAGHDVPLELYVDGQASPPATLSYDPPAITAVTPTHGRATGGNVITIHGANFGSAAAVTVGGASCPVETQTDGRVECTLPPPSGSPPDLRVTVGGQASNSVPYSYQAVASKCDSMKLKAAGSYAACLNNAEVKASKKGIDSDTATLAKCGDKFLASCEKVESKSSDCSRPGTCLQVKQSIRVDSWAAIVE